MDPVVFKYLDGKDIEIQTKSNKYQGKMIGFDEGKVVLKDLIEGITPSRLTPFFQSKNMIKIR